MTELSTVNDAHYNGELHGSRYSHCLHVQLRLIYALIMLHALCSTKWADTVRCQWRLALLSPL